MKRTMKQEIAYRVAKGVRFMNREYGRSWLREIDPEQLALDDCKACVLGQVEGDYYDGVEKLDIDGEDYGFELQEDERGTYPALTREWRKHITRLQKLFAIKAPHREML